MWKTCGCGDPPPTLHVSKEIFISVVALSFSEGLKQTWLFIQQCALCKSRWFTAQMPAKPRRNVIPLGIVITLRTLGSFLAFYSLKRLMSLFWCLGRWQQMQKLNSDAICNASLLYCDTIGCGWRLTRIRSRHLSGIVSVWSVWSHLRNNSSRDFLCRCVIRWKSSSVV